MTIEIENLTEAQELAIKDLLAVWQYLGSVGSSRWTAFYADGDGNFHPKILIDGAKPKHHGYPSKRWKTMNQPETYMIDFDEIAWALRRRGAYDTP